MSYDQQTWNNGDPGTPLSADRLAHIEAGIANAQDAADASAVTANAASAAATSATSTANTANTTANAAQTTANAAVPATRTVAGHALSADVPIASTDLTDGTTTGRS